jgi:hypothetical protein
MDRRHFLNTAFLSIWCCLSAVCFLYRVIVKQTFEYYFMKKMMLIRVIIYGTDTNAISVANALNLKYQSRFKIV